MVLAFSVSLAFGRNPTGEIRAIRSSFPIPTSFPKENQTHYFDQDGKKCLHAYSDRVYPPLQNGFHSITPFPDFQFVLHHNSEGICAATLNHYESPGERPIRFLAFISLIIPVNRFRIRERVRGGTPNMDETNIMNESFKRSSGLLVKTRSDEDLVDVIKKVLETDNNLDFLFELKTAQLEILAASIRDRIGRKQSNGVDF